VSSCADCIFSVDDGKECINSLRSNQISKFEFTSTTIPSNLCSYYRSANQTAKAINSFMTVLHYLNVKYEREVEYEERCTKNQNI